MGGDRVRSPAKWTIATPSRSVGADGTATVTVALSDTGKKQGELAFTMTADRQLTVTWTQTAGEPIDFMGAWSNV
jgi:hypothetical protein